MTNSITVTAQRWAHGWEIIIDEENATQVRTLAKAPQQVRDYLDTLYPETDHSQLEVHLTYEEVESQLQAARAAQRAAQKAEEEATQKIRKIVAQLRTDGVSLSDTAAILEVSKSRVQQLQAA
ncbi:antitoxin HicB [Rothia endophytica]|uniref:antitoxin HicB n=1 Tax=Rothia endophytica TaxID=1324766 RepID=UPI001F1F83BE|nr:antitoxin HicB [Rothia endophytica]